MKTKNIWKSIPEFEGIYEVSNTGMVRSLDRITTHGRKLKGRLLSFGDNGRGYKFVFLCRGGIKPKSYYIHRLVAEAFVPNPHKKPQVNHKNLDSYDNSVNNLEWLTADENYEHARQKNAYLKGQDQPTSKLTEKQVIQIRSLSSKLNYTQISKKFNVGPDQISNIINRRAWQHI